MIKSITKPFQAKLQTSTKILKSSEFVSDPDNFFVNRFGFVEKPVAALLLNADIVSGNAVAGW